MRIVTGNTVRTADGKTLAIAERTADNYVIGKDDKGNARLFKPNGQYAGSARDKNVVEVL